MKYLSIVCLCLCLVACGSEQFTDSEGRTYTLRDWQDKTIVLNYWAKWCAPCLAEMPTLSNFFEANKDKLIVLGVSYELETSTALQAYAKAHGVTYPLLLRDPGPVFGVSNVRQVPTTYIIRQGKIIQVLYGEQTQEMLAAAVFPNRR